MMRKSAFLLTALLAPMGLAACGVQKPQTHDQFVASAVTAVGGAAIGSYIGGQFGGGAGNIMMMIFGGALGAMAGWAEGGTLMPSDREAFRSTTQKAMETARDGQVITWANPETQVAGSVTPTRSFVGRGGLQCRAFEASVAAKDGVGRGAGTACRTADGNWYVYGLNDSNV